MQENYHPGQVDKNLIARDFGTTPDKLSLHFRHLIGIGKRDGRKGFLKLATAPGTISRYTENEAEILTRRATGRYPLPIDTASLQTQGIYDYEGQQLSWFITDYIEGKNLYTLTPENPADPNPFQNYLPSIVDTTIAIIDWPQEPQMPIDVPKNTVAHEVINKVQGWMNDRLSTPEMVTKTAKAYDLQEQFFSNVKDLESLLDIGPSHGDFQPDDFRVTKTGELYLLDMEHTKMHWLKFYDAAYMYHRLYTKYRNPELAKVFLKMFIERYSENHTFDERAEQNVRIALAQRLIGGYFDAVADGVTSWELQDELSTKLLESESLEVLTD